MPAPFVRSPYNYDVDQVSDETGLKCEDPSLAQEHFKEECDINTIVQRFGLTGELPDAVQVPSYADFDQVYDYHSAMNLVTEANEAFMSMPAELRARFRNDPGALVDFCSDQANVEEARKLGLALSVPMMVDGKPTGPAVISPSAEPVVVDDQVKA